MKVLHAALQRDGSPGIVKQMKWELDGARSLGLPWVTKIYTIEKVPGSDCMFEYIGVPYSRNCGFLRRFVGWCKSNAAYYIKLNRARESYDILLLRHAIANPFQLLFLLANRLFRIPVYLVHHTLEGKELRAGKGVIWRAAWLAELVLGPLSIRSASGTIAVTQEIAAYEMKRSLLHRCPIIYPNGVQYNDFNLDDERGSVPEIIFIASYFYSWHGLDKLLDSIESASENFRLHLVGVLNKEDNYRASLDSRIVIHGLLEEKKINKLYQRCWVGLSSFCLDRKGMKEACTLKVREYLALGIPVYAGHDDVFGEDFEYYKNGAPRWTAILSFADKMRLISREQVAMKAKTYIDKSQLVGCLYESLKRA